MNQDGGPPDGEAPGESEPTVVRELPAVDFSTFVLSLGHSVLMNLGDAPDLEVGDGVHDLVMAKQTIDVIELLAEKTRGNLSGEEERLLEQLLYDLRSRYAAAQSGK